MNALKKNRVKSVLKYTWPFYIVAGVGAFILMSFIYKAAHPIPKYKTLTLFVSGQVTNERKLNEDITTKFEDKQIRSFTCISSTIYDTHYRTKLTVSGYNSADILIIPTSKIDSVSNPGSFAISLKDELVNSLYQGFTFYSKNEVNYGVKIDKNKVEQYMTLPNEDCYMFLNGKSQNLGKYSIYNPVVEHDMALNVVKDWGM